MDDMMHAAIDQIGANTAAAIERGRQAGNSEDDLRQMLDMSVQSFRTMWTGKLSEPFLDALLSELTTSIERHREALTKRVN